jgi:SAM-dependent methyltransferase
MSLYSRRFFERREQRVTASAEALVPQVIELLRPKSVIDIGCANGLWLEAFAKRGVQVRGVDGPWVPQDSLHIPRPDFRMVDLANTPLPYQLGEADERFDLLLSFELLEHLPAARADAMIDAMCSLSDTLLISAAVPHQGGTGHINEQWPDFWVERFAARGFTAYDFLRLALWTDERIAPWYRQNVIGYFRHGAPAAVRDFFARSVAKLAERPLPLCHPGVFSYKLGKLRNSVRNPFRALATSVKLRYKA